MNVERWLKLRNPSWQKLEELLRLGESSGLSSLDRYQLQDLGRLYRATSADLSRARAMKLGQDVQVYLNNLVVKAHNQVYQTKSNRWVDFVNFIWYGFPALVRQHVIYVLCAFLIFFAPFYISFVLVQQDNHFAQLEVAKGHPLVPEELWNMIEHHHMWTDSAQDMSAPMASLIATNNIKVAILAFVFGITFGIGTVFVLATNGLSIGTVLGLCKAHGMDAKLWQFVAGHGILEMSAIFICGGAGLLLAKSLLFPGQNKRVESLKMVAKDAACMFGGCVPIFLVAGTIEGFISPRTDLSNSVKLAVSLSTLAFLLLYLLVPREKRGSRSRLVQNE
jgi:uncharacterized membrane protein SpoIIM required for sporulation